eukprot:s1202_g15.t1
MQNLEVGHHLGFDPHNHHGIITGTYRNWPPVANRVTCQRYGAGFLAQKKRHADRAQLENLQRTMEQEVKRIGEAGGKDAEAQQAQMQEALLQKAKVDMQRLEKEYGAKLAANSGKARRECGGNGFLLSFRFAVSGIYPLRVRGWRLFHQAVSVSWPKPALGALVASLKVPPTSDHGHGGGSERPPAACGTCCGASLY